MPSLLSVIFESAFACWCCCWIGSVCTSSITIAVAFGVACADTVTVAATVAPPAAAAVDDVTVGTSSSIGSASITVKLCGIADATAATLFASAAAFKITILAIKESWSVHVSGVRSTRGTRSLSS